MLIVAALYHFTPFPDPQALKAPLARIACANGVRGTLLLAREGINGTIAGTREGIDAVLAQPKMPNSVIGSGEACQCEDHFKAAHPDTDWEAALIHSEKIGLGSREYELVKI